jgi:drug/metabolite transporter (DMT)-like permease
MRSYVGGFALLLLSFVMSKIKKQPLVPKEKSDRKRLLITGIVCGIFLCIAANFQQFGIAAYPVEAAASARSGFLTAMYILFVPIFSIFLKKRPAFTVLIAVLIAVVGLYFLCFANGISGVYGGDGIVLICAVAFALHIICVDTLGQKVDGVKLSCIQFIVAGAISCVCMFLFEEPKVSSIIDNTVPILYAGIGSSGIAYTLQIIGQKYSPPTLASLAMSFESVFAVLSQVVVAFVVYLLGKGELVLPTHRELIGCAVMFAAILIAQFEFPKIKKNVTE